jgi:uncharacterized membrane protein
MAAGRLAVAANRGSRVTGPVPHRRFTEWLGGLALCAGLLVPPAPLQQPVVRAVLFYSPACPHCHQVITVSLPPIAERFGEQLEILAVDTTQEAGHALFRAAIDRFSIPRERQGVPMLVIGETVLVGSAEIPLEAAQWIDRYLTQGGVDWPDIPGLAEAIAAAFPTATARPSAPATSSPRSTPVPTSPESPALEALAGADEPPGGFGVGFVLDPVGSAISSVVLLFILLSIGWVVREIVRNPTQPPPKWHDPAVGVLCLIGLAVAGYLAYIEATASQAVCGPVGDCNAVQQSPYARLFGVIPMGVLGLAGYAALCAAWLGRRVSAGRWSRRLGLALFAMTLFGTLLSLYLTFLEPFVIGANCAWCLTSAVVMALLLRLTAAGALSRSLVPGVPSTFR